jgi:hypothetical protein
VTTTDAMIGTLSTGLETFRADRQVGGLYPPSASDWANNNGVFRYRVMSPYEALSGGPTGAFEISGAGLLVWALAGADLSGVPGFRAFRNAGDNPTQQWSRDTDDDRTTAEPGAYALHADTYAPLQARVGPFVDLAKVEATRWNANAETDEGAGSFEIPAEAEAQASVGVFPAKRNYPMFVDAFGGPILYWRADPAGIQAVDRSPNNTSSPQARHARGIYHFLDNGSLLCDVGGGPGSNQTPVILRPRDAAEPHNLRWSTSAMQWGDVEVPGPDSQLDGFWAYVRNKDVQAKIATHKADSFLLISAGPDGIYGTGDDIANFQHNGAELSEP